MLKALLEAGGPAEAVREFAHILGAEETWLARLEGRAPRAAVWPDATLDMLPDLAREVHAGLNAYLAGIDDTRLDAPLAYTNSKGQTFSNPVREILLHAALHGQYHRGKINLLLRQAGFEPAPVDLIGFLRGVPAASTRRP